jgi:hypothetical protein
MLALNLATWDRHFALADAPSYPEHGCPSPRRIREAVLAAIHDLILPGFERLDVDTTEARAWYASATAR